MIKTKQKKKKSALPEMSAKSDKKKRGLGKSLGDLGLSELLRVSSGQSVGSMPVTLAAEFKQLPLYRLKPGVYQPRRHIDEIALQELADSIRAQGIIQPIVVRRFGEDYEIIAGERRWRAAQLANLEMVPTIVRDISNETAMAFSLIENIQRQDLNVIEEALALQKLLQDCRMTHEAVAEAVGKSRTSVTNTLRLLKLNADVRAFLEKGQLEMGHARALLALEGHKQSECAKIVVQRQLSVRETESMVRRYQNPISQTNSKKQVDPDIARLQTKLSDKLGARVFFQHDTSGIGKLIIHYNSVAELEGILERIR